MALLRNLEIVLSISDLISKLSACFLFQVPRPCSVGITGLCDERDLDRNSFVNELKMNCVASDWIVEFFAIRTSTKMDAIISNPKQEIKGLHFHRFPWNL